VAGIRCWWWGLPPPMPRLLLLLVMMRRKLAAIRNDSRYELWCLMVGTAGWLVFSGLAESRQSVEPPTDQRLCTPVFAPIWPYPWMQVSVQTRGVDGLGRAGDLHRRVWQTATLVLAGPAKMRVQLAQGTPESWQFELTKPSAQQPPEE
jgi:hypothetical protein